jgi:predicted TIM-barrel fold metal-dependent hydrolase
MDSAGVDRAILVPPSWAAGGTPETLASAAKQSDRFRVIGRISFESGIAPQQAEIERWLKDPLLAGIRIVLHTEDTVESYRRGHCNWVWETAERYCMPIMVYTPTRPDLLREFASEHPTLRFAADHLLLPFKGFSAEDVKESIKSLLPLAALPNVSVKASTLPLYSRELFPFRDLHPLLYEVIAAFGANRVFWGSDLTRLKCVYGDCVRMFTEELTELNEGDRDLIVGGAICSWLEWK